MEYKMLENDWYIVRIKRGERIVEEIKKVCEAEKIEGGLITGIGAVDQVELALYDVTKKEYHKKVVDQPFEVTNITGTIGVEKELIVHLHITLTDKEMKAFGGHLVDARVSGTAEIFIKKTEKLLKKYDEETGLKLFNW